MTASATPAAAHTDVDPVGAARLLARSERLARRHFALLPLSGPGAAFTEVQGRAPGESTAPEGLAELISSIATIGVLQPILVEELDDGRRRLVSGERRLRAAKWLATSDPDDSRYQTIPAVVCPGPLGEEERRVWQLVENLAREDLRPGELAAALLFERCAVLAAKLLAAGVTVPVDVAALDDPVARFRALDRLRVRAGQSRIGAPWPEVLARLGVQIPERKAQQLARALAALPADLCAEMDAAKVALHTRLRYLQLDRGNRDAARGLWDAVKQRRRPELLAAAVHARLDDPGLDPDQAVDAAETAHAAANDARRRAAHPTDAPATTASARTPGQAPGDLVDAALQALGRLAETLEHGGGLSRFDAGSLRLAATRLLDALADRAGSTDAA